MHSCRRRRLCKPKKAQATENKVAKKQKLEALRKDAETNPDRQGEIDIINKEISDIEKETQAMEAEEQRLSEMIPMDEEQDVLQPDESEQKNVSPAARLPNIISQAEDSNSNTLGQGGVDDNKFTDKDGNNGNNVEYSGYPTPFSSDNEEDEIPVMTVSDYKTLMGRPSTDREVVAWKPGGGRRGDMVITRYGPKSHPMFRIERASEVDGFDSKNIPDITSTEPQHYRIGERKQGRKWCYDYKHVDGIVAVAYTPIDDEKPLDTIDPAWYARHTKKRYVET